MCVFSFWKRQKKLNERDPRDPRNKRRQANEVRGLPLSTNQNWFKLIIIFSGGKWKEKVTNDGRRFWWYIQKFWTITKTTTSKFTIENSFISTEKHYKGCQNKGWFFNDLESSDNFHFRWLNNSVIEIG